MTCGNIAGGMHSHAVVSALTGSTGCSQENKKKILTLMLSSLLLIVVFQSVDGYEAKEEQIVGCVKGHTFASVNLCKPSLALPSNLILFDIYYFVLLRFPFSTQSFLQPMLHKKYLSSGGS